MMSEDFFIFDMDGTLFDTIEDLAFSADHVMAEFGLRPYDRSVLMRYISCGAISVLQEFQNFHDDGETKKVFARFMQFYIANCCRQTNFYPGAKELLEIPFRAALLTNKHSLPTKILLERFGLADRFEVVLCSDTAPARKPSPEGILKILEMTGIPKEKAVMVGDDGPDIQAAKAAGIRSIGIMGGYGSQDVLQSADPDSLFSSIGEFAKAFTQAA